MKVKELIEKLNSMPAELDIICYTEDESLVGPKNINRVLKIVDVTKTNLKIKRKDDILRILFTTREQTEPFVLFEITSSDV